jgi:4-amino-4-deoxy-L-arabinose transferase-like glycosyltransferase
MERHENHDSETIDHTLARTESTQARLDRPMRAACVGTRKKILICAAIFSIALGIRMLNWSEGRNEVSTVQTSVVLNYKHLAHLIRDNGLASLFDARSPTADPDLLGHPPGYPVLLSLIYRVAPESDTAVQIVQMVLDSLSTVIVCLIAFELFPIAIAVIAGLLAALAPQFSWNAITLLPDSLAALPILLAVYLIILARTRLNRDRLFLILVAGALIGVSCWLRANAFLLAPFMALLFPIIFKRGQRLRPALVLIGGAVLVIGALTIRNAVVFGNFIPVSLGAGQTLVEGIADYNTDGSLGLPQTDMELQRAEAESYNRPAYAKSLFTPDGVARDRARFARGVAVIRAHPFWFFGVMISRAASMMRLERTPLRLETMSSETSARLFQQLLRAVQKLFITAVMLPLVLLGTSILVYKRQIPTLGILLVVPCYYFGIQSALHTEYRYVLVIHYFLFVLAAVGIYTIGAKVRRRFLKN